MARNLSAETLRRLSEAGKRTWTPEFRIRISAALKGKSLSLDHRRQISSALTGHRCSDETKARISEGLTRSMTPENLKKRSESAKAAMTLEVRRRISETKKSKPNGRLGKHHSAATRMKISAGLIGNTCCLGRVLPDETKTKISAAQKGKHCPAKQGPNHWNWKGGRWHSFRQAIASTIEYKQWRQAVFTRDKFTCQRCEKHGGYLHAHHLESFQDIVDQHEVTTLDQALACEDLWSLDNGKTLCKPCHRQQHKETPCQKEL